VHTEMQRYREIRCLWREMISPPEEYERRLKQR